jgi:hypothetical protein
MRQSLVALALLACSAPPPPGRSQAEILGSNALASNRLMSNRLMSNALTTNRLMSNALTHNALTTNRLMSNALTSNALRPDGLTEGEVARQFLSYVYSCAMPADAGLALVVDGQDYGRLEGGLGLAPEWGQDAGRCDEHCQRFITACLLARTNFWGVPVQISLRGDHPSLLPTEDEKAQYPLREGTYFGNLFVNVDDLDRQIYACTGPGSSVPQLTNRFCSGGSGLCALKVGYDCVNPDPPLDRAQHPYSDLRFACARLDPNDGFVRDCYTGGLSAYGDAPSGVRVDEAITVYLKEPVAICGDGVCTGSEAASTCASDCTTGWARGFAGFGSAQGLAQTPDGGLVLLVSGSVDFGGGPLIALPDEPVLALARLDAAGEVLGAREVAHGVFAFGRTDLFVDPSGAILLVGDLLRPAWFGGLRVARRRDRARTGGGQGGDCRHRRPARGRARRRRRAGRQERPPQPEAHRVHCVGVARRRGRGVAVHRVRLVGEGVDERDLGVVVPRRPRLRHRRLQWERLQSRAHQGAARAARARGGHGHGRRRGDRRGPGGRVHRRRARCARRVGGSPGGRGLGGRAHG